MRIRTCFILALTAIGCGTNATNNGSPDMATSSSTYLPFSASNMAAQQVRIGIYEEISAIRRAMGFDKTRCGDLSAPAAGTIAEAYTRNDATAGVLRDKVKTRLDDHAYNLNAAIGEALDKTISEALDQCNLGTITPQIAGQLVEKTLLGFFYFSVYHELALGQKLDAESPEKWDEAFGYYGRSTDGATNKGFAAAAAGRDMNYNTTLNNTIFADLIKGRGQVAGKESAIAQTVEKLDRNLTLVLAYYTAREFQEFAEETDPAVELAEGKALFAALEPHLKSIKPADATYIRDQIDKTTYATAKTIDAAGIVSRLEMAYGIDVTP